MTSDKEYVGHGVFEDLQLYAEFYEHLGSLVFTFHLQGTDAFCNFDSYVYSSIHGTLESIETTLKNGRISDAYALLRRFYDSSIINIYTNIFLHDHFAVENLTVKEINDWLRGKQKIPEYRIMSQYIRSSDKCREINELLYADNHYKLIRDRCNGHTHYNHFYHVLLNDSSVYLPNRHKSLDQFQKDIRDVLTMHLAYIFYLNDHYMMSRDYIDSLECGISPEPDSEYWVCPFIQEIFDSVVTKYRPDVAAAIKQKTSMHLN